MNRSILVAIMLLMCIDFLHANVEKDDYKLAFFNETNHIVLEAKKKIAQKKNISKRAKEVALNAPQDLVLAMSGLETAYGTSGLFLKNKNCSGMTKKSKSSTKIQYRKFEDLEECFVATLENLAENKVYHRIQQKIINGEDDSKNLAKELIGTYVIGDNEYAKKITDIIRQNNLSRFNDDV